MFDRRAAHGSLLLPAMLGSVGAFLLIGWMSSAPAPLQAPGVEIGPNHVRQASAGQVVTYHHTLTNTGTMTDTFWLQALSVQGWPVELLGGDYPTGTMGVLVLSQVGPYTSTSFQVSLTIPQASLARLKSRSSPPHRSSAQRCRTPLKTQLSYLPGCISRWC
jgi:hypothetical protein